MIRAEAPVNLRRMLRPHAVDLILGPGVLGLRRGIHRARRLGRRRLVFFHQADDPYSLLLAQVLPGLADAAGAELEVVDVGPPDAAFTPDVERLTAWAWRDGAALADEYGLSLPPRPETPAVIPPARRRLHRLGHYQGGTVFYEGEWFWGLDRLGLLEERLRAEGLDIPPTLQPKEVAAEPQPADSALEFFCSFRSPYSYLAIEPTFALARELGVELRIRPVLPMVMRGLAVPKSKVMYIARDCARLARQQGQPFGRIADPLGPGIANCLALFLAAGDRQQDLVRSLGRGTWSEGLDVTHDPHLRTMAERAGLTWDPAVDRQPGLDLAETNRQALLDLGLWGVPSYRYGRFTAWGQDRLPRLRRVIEASR